MGYIETKLEHVARTVALEAELTRTTMAAGLEATQRGMRIDGALARQLVANAVNINASGRLVGWSVRAAGGPATVTLRDGRSPDGDVLATFGLSADGASSQQWAGPAGVSFGEALYAEVTGTVVGSVWIGAVD